MSRQCELIDKKEYGVWVPHWPGRPKLRDCILTMYRTYDIYVPTRRCKTCRHLWCRRLGNRYYKCLKSRVTGGPATDWRINWPACGLWEKVDDA